MKLWCHWVLPVVSHSYPHARGTLPMHSSPFRHSTCSPKGAFACDLHALATPPAFDLSQDQTRHLNLFLPDRPGSPKTSGRGRDSVDVRFDSGVGSVRDPTGLRPAGDTPAARTKAKLKILITQDVTRILSDPKPRKWPGPIYDYHPASDNCDGCHSRATSS